MTGRALLVLLSLVACSMRAPAPPAPRTTVAAAPMTAPDPAGDPPYFEFQVDKPAAPLPDNPPPQYPDSLRAAHVEGEVLAQFIVDATGRVEINTFKVLRSSREAFATAVQDVLPTLHFSPAEITGRTVKQLVQMPFVFGLPK